MFDRGSLIVHLVSGSRPVEAGWAPLSLFHEDLPNDILVRVGHVWNDSAERLYVFDVCSSDEFTERSGDLKSERIALIPDIIEIVNEIVNEKIVNAPDTVIIDSIHGFWDMHDSLKGREYIMARNETDITGELWKQ